MAQVLYVAENLGFPFSNIRELTMVISPSGNRVASRGNKLVLILGGECQHRFEGGTSTKIQQGDLVCADGSAAQRYAQSEDGSERLHAFVIILDIAKSDAIENAQREALYFLNASFSGNVVHKGVIDSAIINQVASIREEMHTQLPGFRWRVSALCSTALIQLARHLAEKSTDEMQHHSAATGTLLVRDAKEYLLKNLGREMIFDDISQFLHVSNGHLARTFKRITGESLFTHIRHLRLERAKLKLLNSEHNISEIAQQCGFSSTTLFCRNFKSYTGKTPLTYRNDLTESE